MMLYRCFRVLAVLLACSVPVYARAAELEVSELIGAMKQSVEEARKAAKPPYANVLWMEGEVRYVVKREGEAGFKAYVVTAEGKYATEAVQVVKFRLEPSKGEKWKVEREIEDAIVAGYDPKARRLFITKSADDWSDVMAILLRKDTKITDLKGSGRLPTDINAGKEVRVRLTPTPSREGEAMADAVIIK